MFSSLNTLIKVNRVLNRDYFSQKYSGLDDQFQKQDDLKA